MMKSSEKLLKQHKKISHCHGNRRLHRKVSSLGLCSCAKIKSSTIEKLQNISEVNYFSCNLESLEKCEKSKSNYKEQAKDVQHELWKICERTNNIDESSNYVMHAIENKKHAHCWDCVAKFYNMLYSNRNYDAKQLSMKSVFSPAAKMASQVKCQKCPQLWMTANWARYLVLLLLFSLPSSCVSQRIVAPQQNVGETTAGKI